MELGLPGIKPTKKMTMILMMEIANLVLQNQILKKNQKILKNLNQISKSNLKTQMMKVKI